MTTTTTDIRKAVLAMGAIPSDYDEEAIWNWMKEHPSDDLTEVILQFEK